MCERSFGQEILAIVSIKLQWHELESGTMFEMLHRVAPIEWDAYMRKGNIKNLKKIYTNSVTQDVSREAVRFKQQSTLTFLYRHRFIQVPSPLGNESAFEEWIRKIPNRLGLNYLPR